MDKRTANIRKKKTTNPSRTVRARSSTKKRQNTLTVTNDFHPRSCLGFTVRLWKESISEASKPLSSSSGRPMLPPLPRGSAVVIANALRVYARIMSWGGTRKSSPHRKPIWCTSNGTQCSAGARQRDGVNVLTLLLVVRTRAFPLAPSATCYRWRSTNERQYQVLHLGLIYYL